MDRYVHVTDESMEDAVRCFEKRQKEIMGQKIGLVQKWYSELTD